MREEEIYRALTNIFHDVFLREDIALKPETSAHDIAEWDSFKQVEIILAAEQYFRIRFSTREVDGLKTVSDLVSVVAAKTAKRRGTPA